VFVSQFAIKRKQQSHAILARQMGLRTSFTPFLLARLERLQNEKHPVKGTLAFVAQRIEHLTTDQKVGGSSPSKRTSFHFQNEGKTLAS
jgi:hypothetical protein